MTALLPALIALTLLLPGSPVVSDAWYGGPANGPAGTPSVSADGRYTAFASTASNLVRGDTNGRSDVFAHDLVTGRTRLVGPGEGPTSMSADGRQVAYADGDRVAVNGRALAPGDSPSLSADGRVLVFRSPAALVPADTNTVEDVYAMTLATGALDLLSPGSDRGAHHGTAVSADGRWVAFPSAATNLVPGDTNGSVDVFVRDRATGTTTRANTTAEGGQSSSYTLMPAITGDGGRVFFVAWGDNLVPGDTEDTPDLFEKTLATGAIRRVSTRADGTPANAQPYQPSVSADGRYAAFATIASNLVPGDNNNVDDVFLKDLRTGELTLVSKRGKDFSVSPALSGDGRVVAYTSYQGDHPGVRLTRAGRP